jgi:hypothetical protein
MRFSLVYIILNNLVTHIFIWHLLINYVLNLNNLSIGLRRWYNINITILDIIYCPVFYLKHNISEAWFCLHPQVEPT